MNRIIGLEFMRPEYLGWLGQKIESLRRKREEKWETCWCCRGQQRACRMAQAQAVKT